MNVLSLFDGMSCGQLALRRSNIPYSNYYASEIDPYAIKVAQSNFPLTNQVGDVTCLKGSTLPTVDLLLGGSPCQGFSFAGKGLNFSDPRSRLFFEYVRLLNETNPKWFLLENVNMKKEHQNVITGFLGVEPIKINSALVSAQNRERLYWTNIEGVTEPEDNQLVLGDVVGIAVKDKASSVVVMKNIYPRKGQNGNVYALRGKSKTLSAGTGVKGNGIGSSNAPKVEWDNRQGWRRLTPTECERLQTVPDGYTAVVSDTQRYKMLGNGWTVNVVAHILKGIR